MRSTQRSPNLFPRQQGLPLAVRRSALSGIVLSLILALSLLIQDQLVFAQNPSGTGAFVTGMEDVPLMSDLQDVPEAAVIFDKPAGRLIEAYAEGNVETAAVIKFYRETLPQLGWSIEAAKGATGVFFRESERLEIHVLEGTDRRTVRFVLSPR